MTFFSCDLPGEADKDCNGVENGLATIDDCGICSGGNTTIEHNQDLDVCNNCFGNNICCSELCADDAAINYCESTPDGLDSTQCIYDLCTDYFQSNSEFICETTGSSPYTIGEQLNCETLETQFSMCYPSDCQNLLKLSDFEDKIIFIIYEEDW